MSSTEASLYLERQRISGHSFKSKSYKSVVGSTERGSNVFCEEDLKCLGFVVLGELIVLGRGEYHNDAKDDEWSEVFGKCTLDVWAFPLELIAYEL